MKPSANPRSLSRAGRLFLLLLPLLGSGLQGAASWPEGYYDRLDGKKKETLKNAAKTCVSNHQRLDYYGLPANWIYTDVYPELYDGMQRWWEMYSDEPYLIRTGQTPNSSFSANRMQREHSVPKSWWKRNGDVEYTPAYTDLWNLYPSDGAANQAKSNYPFGVCRSVEYTNGVTRVGPPVSGQGGGCGMVFEPADEYKGDFARTIFYMATVYDDLPWAINYMFTANSTYPTLRSWAVETLLQWSRRDPVSQKEIDRNDAVESQQGNRNPFIDFPELAEYIWGTRMQETFLIAEQGGQITPPIEGDPEITAPVSGEALDFGEAAEGSTISRILEIRGGNLTAPLSLSISGRDRSMFRVAVPNITSGQLNATGLYRLTVFYTPTTQGQHEASLVIYDGGLPDGATVAVSLRGEGCPVPQLSTLTAYEATDITSDSYLASWSAAPEVVDYYILSRVRYLDGSEGDSEEGDLLESDTNSLEVTGRDPSVAESYSVMSVRLGYRSEPSNSILVASDTGIAGEELPAATHLVREPSGLRVVTARERIRVRIHDAGGRLLDDREARDGDIIPIPEATFIIVEATGLRHPVKL